MEKKRLSKQSRISSSLQPEEDEENISERTNIIIKKKTSYKPVPREEEEKATRIPKQEWRDLELEPGFYPETPSPSEEAPVTQPVSETSLPEEIEPKSNVLKKTLLLIASALLILSSCVLIFGRQRICEGYDERAIIRGCPCRV